MPQVSWTKPVYHMSLSDNSSGYDETLRENNLQLIELQFYINNIIRCIGIVDILSEERKDHQFNTLINYYTFLQVNYLKITIAFNNTLIFYQFQRNHQPII